MFDLKMPFTLIGTNTNARLSQILRGFAGESYSSSVVLERSATPHTLLLKPGQHFTLSGQL